MLSRSGDVGDKAWISAVRLDRPLHEAFSQDKERKMRDERKVDKRDTDDSGTTIVGSVI